MFKECVVSALIIKINDSCCLLRMYGGTGGPWPSSDEFVRVEKDQINGGLDIATCAFQ